MKNLILLIFLFIAVEVQAQPQWVNYTPQNSGLPSYDVRDISFDSFNRKWIGTSEGIAMFDGTIWTVYNTSNSELPGNSVYSIAVDKKNIVWAATNNGLARFDGNNWAIYDTLGFKDISRILVDSNNIKWVTSYLGGLMKYNDTNWVYYRTNNSGIQSNLLSDLAFEGNIKWIAAGHNGLIRFNDTTFINYTTTNSGIGSNSLKCISVDRNGDKWIGRFLNFAVKYDSKNNIWLEYNNNWPGITGGSVLAILNDSRNVKWFGTYDALYSYNDTIVISHSPPLLQGIFGNFVEDKYGNNWFCNGYGLFVYNPNGVVSVKEENLTFPSKFYVYQNYPNPFNQLSIINFKCSIGGNVSIVVYDLLGSEVKTLVNEYKQPGTYQVNFNAEGLSSGIYFYKMTAGDFSETKKLVFVK
jgi:hypothetical protein